MNCVICGAEGQEVLCSPECSALNRAQGEWGNAVESHRSHLNCSGHCLEQADRHFRASSAALKGKKLLTSAEVDRVISANAEEYWHAPKIS